MVRSPQGTGIWMSAQDDAPLDKDGSIKRYHLHSEILLLHNDAAHPDRGGSGAQASCLLERNWLFSSIGVQQQVLSTASAICPLSYRARMRIKGAISLHSPQTSSAFSRRFPRMEHNAGSLMERRFGSSRRTEKSIPALRAPYP